MAKGQQRSNREAKKPKQEKPKVSAAAPGRAWATTETLKLGQTTQAKKK